MDTKTKLHCLRALLVSTALLLAPVHSATAQVVQTTASCGSCTGTPPHLPLGAGEACGLCHVASPAPSCIPPQVLSAAGTVCTNPLPPSRIAAPNHGDEGPRKIR